jgi:hypothetical protein
MSGAPGGKQAPRGGIVDDAAEDGAYFYGAPGTWRAPVVVRDVSTAAAPSAAPRPGAASASSSSSALPAKPSGPAWSKVVVAKMGPEEVARTAAAAALAEAAASAASASSSSSGADTRPLCAYFASGACRFGDRCRFRHALAVPWATEYFRTALKDAMEVKEKTGASARAAAGEAPVPVAAAPAPSSAPSSASNGGATAAAAAADAEDLAFAAESEAWQASALASRSAMLEKAVAAGVCASLDEAETALQAAERDISTDVECGICLEQVLLIPGRRFGLLSHCGHAFCLGCIREWRARIDLPKETVRACPLCRTLSYYVIGCDRYVADPVRKAAVQHQYHAAQKTIECRHWNRGRGECAFGPSCFYAHLDPDGTPHVYTGAHSFRMDAEGNIFGGQKTHKLSDFL